MKVSLDFKVYRVHQARKVKLDTMDGRVKLETTVYKA